MGVELSDVAETRSGRVQGERRGDHSVFRGIPFARAPAGPLRFRAPAAPDSWTDVRPAVRFGPAAPQGVSFAPGSAAEGPSSEDCLHLNVYTPATDGRKQRPVLFWIHGGAFTVGSSSSFLYDGGPLAELGDVVVVTANYRLGALGFLVLGDAGAQWGASPNLGILDQIAALRWVQDNIENFGGDPGNVTVFGESAGATSVALLLTAPAAQGLFHRAIAQSPAESLTLPDPEQAGRITDRFLGALGISRGTETRALQDLPLARILHAQASLETGSDYWRGFAPVRDAATLPDHPRVVLGRGEGARVPLLIGTNRDEWNLFALATVTDWNDPMDDDAAVEHLTSSAARGRPEAAEHLLRTYRDSRGARGLRHDNRALLRAIEGDRRFRMPALAFADAYRARGVPVFEYLFTHESPALRGLLGACHALELPFVFGTLGAPQQDRFAGKGAAAEGLSRTMMRAWLAFARTADPNPELPRVWPRYDSETRTTMIFNTATTLPEDAPFEEERRAWDVIEP